MPLFRDEVPRAIAAEVQPSRHHPHRLLFERPVALQSRDSEQESVDIDNFLCFLLSLNLFVWEQLHDWADRTPLWLISLRAKALGEESPISVLE